MCGKLLIQTMMISAIVKPYRIKVYNIIGVGLLSVFIQILFSAASLPFGGFKSLKTFEWFLTTMIGVGLMVPLVYITMLAVYKILPKTWITFIMKHTILHCCCHQSHLQRDAYYYREGKQYIMCTSE